MVGTIYIGLLEHAGTMINEWWDMWYSISVWKSCSIMGNHPNRLVGNPTETIGSLGILKTNITKDPIISSGQVTTWNPTRWIDFGFVRCRLHVFFSIFCPVDAYRCGWVVWNHGFFWLSIQLGISSQLTNSIIFQRGRAQPPTSIYIYISIPSGYLT